MSDNVKTFPYLCSQCTSVNCEWKDEDRVAFYCNDCNAMTGITFADKNTKYKWNLKIPPIIDNEDGLFTLEDYEKD